MLENKREQLIEEGEKRGGEMMNREEAMSRKIERGRERVSERDREKEKNRGRSR